MDVEIDDEQTMEPGVVYRKCACGHLIDKPLYKLRYKEPSGKWRTAAVCPVCKDPSATFLYMIKICLECGNKIKSKYSRRISPYCKKCYLIHYNNHRRPIKKRKNTKTYFQAGKQIEEPEKIISEIFCKYRFDCLPMKENAYLHCGGCIKFEMEKIKWERYSEYDPCEWS